MKKYAVWIVSGCVLAIFAAAVLLFYLAPAPHVLRAREKGGNVTYDLKEQAEAGKDLLSFDNVAKPLNFTASPQNAYRVSITGEKCGYPWRYNYLVREGGDVPLRVEGYFAYSCEGKLIEKFSGFSAAQAGSEITVRAGLFDLILVDPGSFDLVKKPINYFDTHLTFDYLLVITVGEGVTAEVTDDGRDLPDWTNASP